MYYDIRVLNMGVQVMRYQPKQSSNLPAFRPQAKKLLNQVGHLEGLNK